MAQNPAPPRPGGPPRPSADKSSSKAGARSRPTGRPRPKKGGASFNPGESPAKPKAALEKPEFVRNPAPKEDGHLSMVPLSGGKTGTYDTGKRDSATSFFAIPNAKAEPAKPAPPAGPTGPVAAGPIAGPVPPAMGMMGPPAIGGIAGPVVGMGGGPPPPGLGMPSHYDPGAIQEGRSSSSRVFVMMALLLILVCGALVVSVSLVVFAVVQNTQEEEIPIPEARPRPEAVAAQPIVDTGGPPIKKAKPTKPRPRRPRPSGTKPRPAPAAAVPAPPPEPAGPTGGTVTVTKPAGQFFTSVDIRCGPGFHERKKFQGDTASVPNVPAESCTLTFKGGASVPPLKFTGARSFRCTGVGGAMVCR